MSEAVCPRCRQPLLLDATPGAVGPDFRCRGCHAPVDPLAVLASEGRTRARPAGRRLAVVATAMLGGLAVLIVVFFILASLAAR